MIIDAANGAADAALLAELARTNKLVVFSETLEPDGYDVIRSVSGTAMDQAMDHLTAHHSRVACLTSAASVRHPAPVRYGAYLAGLERVGLPLREDYVATFTGDERSAYDAAVELLSNPEPPTAIFAASDFAAIAAIHAAQRMRLSVPDDVAIIGVGNATQGEEMVPSLSTVGPVGFFEGLANHLVHRAQNPDAPSRVLEFPWQLLLRDSAPAASTMKKLEREDAK